MSLSHESPDCTGRWDVRTIGGHSYWLCEVCGATGYGTMADRKAAIRENLMGNTLDQLTKEGRELLEEYGKND